MQLPALLIAILAFALGTLVVVLGNSLRNAALDSARDRLGRATEQIATISATSVAALRARYLDVGNQPVVKRALTGERVAPDALRAALERAALPNDSGMPIQLWSADGRRLGWFGDDVPAPAEQGDNRTSVPVVPGAAPGLPVHILATLRAAPGLLQNDSLRLSPMIAEGNVVRLWFVQPIRDGGRTIGFITHQRRPQAGAATRSVLSEMTGSPLDVFYRNADSSVWSTSDGTVMTRPGSTFVAQSVITEHRIGSSPIVVGLQTPTSGVLTRANAATRIALMISAVVLVLGALVAWLVGRGMARPLQELTHAAATLAEGNYHVRAPPGGSVEIRRLADTFNHMAAEVETARAGLENQRRRAEAASSAKSDFLAVMSHELRTPLNAIGGYAELLAMELRGPLTQEQKRDLERIRTSQQHLLALISRVLDLARVESGTVRYEIETLSVDEMIGEVCGLMSPQAASKDVVLEARDGGALTVRADREKLRQILLNLVSNAVRHTPEGGRVTLSAGARGDRRAISVADTGPGIPPDKREIIFEAFVQLGRSLSKGQDGLGLGLSISRDLARGMGGDLVVEERGPGATFTLLLPAEGAAVPSLFTSEELAASAEWRPA